MVPRKRSVSSLDDDETSTPVNQRSVSRRTRQLVSRMAMDRVDVDADVGAESAEPLFVDAALPDPVDVTARVVTPSPPVRKSRSATTTNIDEVRRVLLSDVDQAHVETSRRESKAELVTHKRKLIFGRPVVEIEVKANVRKVYGIVKKLTGSIGGNGSFGPIYGELTMGSMQKMVNLMKEHAGFDSSSRFIDVGSGIGKPNLHVTQDPGVEFSFGIEVETDRWVLGMNSLKGILDAAAHQPPTAPDNSERVQHNCMFACGDITSARSFDPFTHVYMFSIGFPPLLWEKLATIWNSSSSSYLICYHSPRDIIDNYEFDVELVVKTSTSMHGSKEGHTGYIYRRRRLHREDVIPRCDSVYASAWDIVKQGNLQVLQQYVDMVVDARMNTRGAMTRSKKKAM